MQSRKPYFTQLLKNYAFNLRYNFLYLFQECSLRQLSNLRQDIFLLGQTVKTQNKSEEEILKQIYQIFQNTTWLTYRSGFPSLLNEINGSYISDTGWGCMIRVGQMLFANIIRSHRSQKKKQILNEHFLELFNDYHKNSPFSIQKIVKLARMEFNIKPGDWYNPSQISYILSELHHKYLEKQENLTFIVFNSGNLFFDQLITAMLDGGVAKQCNCINKTQVLLCQKCNVIKKQVAVIILCRLGLEAPELKYLTILQSMMKFKSFRGIIGGKPKKALYFLGCFNSYYIYLDPHYVQQAKQEIIQAQQSYYCDSLRRCKNTSIDPSIGISFYLSSIAALNNLYTELHRLKREQFENFFIFMEKTTPNYIKGVKHYQEQNEVFQQI